jgi:RimJ/RimL family protein N-acetyltransferase
MVEIELRPLQACDLEFVSEVRHHPETLRFLHDHRVFSIEDMKGWFAKSGQQWYIIESHGAKVGYVRTSQRDERNRSVSIGADIHPRYRRQGLATLAYQKLFQALRRERWHRVWLEVLPFNAGAIELYKELGFQFEGRKVEAVRCGNQWFDSIVMGMVLNPGKEINAKVVAVYIGDERSPRCISQDMLRLLHFLLEKERTVDPGCPTDTILVYNRSYVREHNNQTEWTKRCEDLLYSWDGASTARGKIRLLVRENVGRSFGAYNHAFALNADDYDYWLFTENDQVLVRAGYFVTGINQMKADPAVGFVAIVSVSGEQQCSPHAHGGVGISSRWVLMDVMAASRYDCPSEVPFTNAIHQLGYKLVNLAMEDVCMSWGHRGKTNAADGPVE